MPPINPGSAAPSSAMDAFQGGGDQQAAGRDGQGQAVQAAMAKLREIQQSIDQFGQQVPSVADDVKKIRQILKGMIPKLAQQASQQTASSEAVPGGGQ